MLTRGWLRRGIQPLMLMVLVAVVLGPATAAAAADCHKVAGSLKLVPVTGTDCPGAVGVCASTAYSGALSGTGFFVGTAVIPTADTPTTAVVLLTGDQTIRLKDGTIQTKDAIVLATTGAGDFAEVDTIVGGDGRWAGSTGVVRAHGRFTIQAGGDGVYVGNICRA